MNKQFPSLDNIRLARMVEVSRVLNSTTNLDDLLKFIITEAAALTDAEAASILLLDPDTRLLRFKATSHDMTPELADTPVPLDNSIAGSILRENQPLIIDDVSQDERWNPEVSKTIQFATQSILGVPMHDGDRPVGVLESINKLSGHFTESDATILSILADHAGVAVEKARLITELTKANQQLSELDELKSSFISVASHELRTPLSVILGYVSFLRDTVDPELASQLDTVMGAAVRLRSLMQDMFNLQFVDAGESALNLIEFDITQLVRELGESRDDAALVKQQTFTVQIPNKPLMIMADRRMIEVVIDNIINNAVKFTPKEGSIEIRVKDQSDEVWIEVEDSGVGIPEDKYERIFERFYQTEYFMRRHHEGMGLGLAIAQELLDLNKGRIWVQSEVNKGSTFFIAIPLSSPS